MAWSSILAWRVASFLISCGVLVHGTSGWRRTVPVDEQGASSSTASNNASGLKSIILLETVRALRLRRSKLPSSRLRRFSDISRAVTSAPWITSCAVFPPGAAQRSATRLPLMSPIRRAGRLAAASCTHQSPSAKPGRSVRLPSTVSRRTEPLGKATPPSFSAHSFGSPFTVKSIGGS